MKYNRKRGKKKKKKIHSAETTSVYHYSRNFSKRDRDEWNIRDIYDKFLLIDFKI